MRRGQPAAFEAIYDRHHRGILAFCAQLLANAEEAQDAAQQVFISAYRDMLRSERPIDLRPWLYAIARNRCLSLLRARREEPRAELTESSGEGLTAEVMRREELRALLVDLRRLPLDQRGALVLAELESLSHAEVGEVLGVPTQKVKALVFQARASLLASRAARDATCQEIRAQLVVARGAELRRTLLRRHLRDCEGCRAFRQDLRRQRRELALALPVLPAVALRKGVLAATVGTTAGATVVGGGLLASSAFTGAILKAIAGVIATCAMAAGTLVVAGELNVAGRLVPYSTSLLAGGRGRAVAHPSPRRHSAPRGSLSAPARARPAFAQVPSASTMATAAGLSAVSPESVGFGDGHAPLATRYRRLPPSPQSGARAVPPLPHGAPRAAHPMPHPRATLWQPPRSAPRKPGAPNGGAPGSAAGGLLGHLLGGKGTAPESQLPSPGGALQAPPEVVIAPPAPPADVMVPSVPSGGGGVAAPPSGGATAGAPRTLGPLGVAAVVPRPPAPSGAPAGAIPPGGPVGLPGGGVPDPAAG